jgi:hypothetical protein
MNAKNYSYRPQYAVKDVPPIKTVRTRIGATHRHLEFCARDAPGKSAATTRLASAKSGGPPQSKTSRSHTPRFMGSLRAKDFSAHCALEPQGIPWRGGTALGIA